MARHPVQLFEAGFSRECHHVTGEHYHDMILITGETVWG